MQKDDVYGTKGKTAVMAWCTVFKISCTYDFLEPYLLTPAKAGGRAFDIFGFIILLKV